MLRPLGGILPYRLPLGAFGLLTLTLALALAVPAAAKGPKCFPREGHCVLVTVNGQRAVAMSKKERRALNGLEERSHYVKDALYRLPDAIRGELDIRGAMVDGSQKWFGDGAEVEAAIVPLDPVEIATEERLAEEPTVRIGGQPVVTVERSMQENRLPPGRYLLRLRLRGQGNWDRQTVYFTVAE